MSIKQACNFFVQWHLTERCNLNCRHCYQTGRMPDELSLPEITEVADEISDMFASWTEIYGVDISPGLTLTGGEPFLRADFRDVLMMLRDRGFDLFVLSNGALITEEQAEMLADNGVKGVQVSIEGTETVHDGLRGKGSFTSALRGVRNLINSGVKVTLNITLSEINAGCIDDMAALSSSLGAHCLGFSRLVPSGRGEQMLGQMLEKKNVAGLYKKIFAMKPEGFEIVTGDPVASQMLSAPAEGWASSVVASGGCAAGVSGLTLLADGTVVPCRRLPVPIGNVRKDSLRELWAVSDVLEALRDRSGYKGKCGACSRWANCRGCRAIAYAYSNAKGAGDFLAEDPQCFIDI